MVGVGPGQKNPKTSLKLVAAPLITHKAPNTMIAEFANTADPDEMAHNEPSHQDLQCLPSSF